MSCSPSAAAAATAAASCTKFDPQQDNMLHPRSPRTSLDVVDDEIYSLGISHSKSNGSKGGNNAATTTTKKHSSSQTGQKKLSVLGALFGDCFCGPILTGESIRGLGQNSQFIELHGLQFIGLGAVMDELTPRERVYDTLEQLSSRTQRMISIGYLVDDENIVGNKRSESIPLDVWTKAYPDDKTMSRNVRRTIASIKEKQFEDALTMLKKDYDSQKRRIMKDNNRYLIGITAHNIGVVCILAGQDNNATALFEEAIELKRDAFGDDHPELAISLDELGIQLFAQEKIEDAMKAFNESKKILTHNYGLKHPRLSMIINNIACCQFLMGNNIGALITMREAGDHQRLRNSNNHVDAKSDLDLLYMAILLNNTGYLLINTKQYDDARASFEEALLIQESVLGNAYGHRAIHDSRSNLEFTNAFHS